MERASHSDDCCARNVADDILNGFSAATHLFLRRSVYLVPSWMIMKDDILGPLVDRLLPFAREPFAGS